jgi:hypothetical protein
MFSIFKYQSTIFNHLGLFMFIGSSIADTQYIFYFRNFHVFSCSSGSHYDLEISFNPDDYFSFTTTTIDLVNVKISGNLFL